MSARLYQIGSQNAFSSRETPKWRPDNRHVPTLQNDKEVSELLFRLREGKVRRPDGVRLVIGLTPIGAIAYLLPTPLEVNIPLKNTSSYSVDDFISLSPIMASSADELAQRLKGDKKEKKSQFLHAKVSASVNAAGQNDVETNAHRTAAFEHARLLYHILVGRLTLYDVGIEMPFVAPRLVVITFNLWSLNVRKQDKTQALLDAAWGEVDIRTGVVDAVQYFSLRPNLNLPKRPRADFTGGETQRVSDEVCAERLREFLERDGHAPLTIVCHDVEKVKTALRALELEDWIAEDWIGIGPLLGFDGTSRKRQNSTNEEKLFRQERYSESRDRWSYDDDRHRDRGSYGQSAWDRPVKRERSASPKREEYIVRGFQNSKMEGTRGFKEEYIEPFEDDSAFRGQRGSSRTTYGSERSGSTSRYETPDTISGSERSASTSRYETPDTRWPSSGAESSRPYLNRSPPSRYSRTPLFLPDGTRSPSPRRRSPSRRASPTPVFRLSENRSRSPRSEGPSGYRDSSTPLFAPESARSASPVPQTGTGATPRHSEQKRKRIHFIDTLRLYRAMRRMWTDNSDIAAVGREVGADGADGMCAGNEVSRIWLTAQKMLDGPPYFEAWEAIVKAKNLKQENDEGSSASVLHPAQSSQHNVGVFGAAPGSAAPPPKDPYGGYDEWDEDDY